MVWYVVRTKSRRERWAAENVERQGCKFYLPCYGVLTAKRGKLQQLKPQILFPSYMFVQPPPDGRWRFLLSTFGVQTLIMWGKDSPAVMPEREIQRLMNRENEHGLVCLPDKSNFTVNETVSPRDGPFAGQRGLYQGMHESGREKVLLEVLGGRRTVLFDTDNLESVV